MVAFEQWMLKLIRFCHATLYFLSVPSNPGPVPLYSRSCCLCPNVGELLTTNEHGRFLLVGWAGWVAVDALALQHLGVSRMAAALECPGLMGFLEFLS